MVVNVAPDADLWRKRPEVGPLLPVASRVVLIRALKPVDEVVSMDTADALRRLSPDIYAKGKDWEGHLAADEEQICREMGIRVCFLDTVEKSSTALLQALLQRWDAYRGSGAVRDGG